MNNPTHTEDTQPCPNVFSSVEFGKFLTKQFPKNAEASNPFLSKDNSLPAFDASVFKSKDAFSNIFASSDWDMKFPKETPKPILPPPKKTMQSAFTTEDKAALKSVLSSKEWMPMNTLGTHIDVSYSQDMFVGCNSEPTANTGADTDLQALLPPAKTDWDNMFFSQLQLVPPPAPEAVEPEAIPDSLSQDEELPEVEASQEIEMPPPQKVDVTGVVPKNEEADPVPSQQMKKKRKRKPRKKVTPEVKVYVEPADGDVLLGRGGRSNHHPGNKRYREEVKNLQTWYLGIEDKDEKTDLSQCLVDYVQSYDGRFLEKDANGWYEVPNIVARRKASQALREDNDPEKRAAKRSRFLKKRAAMEKVQGQEAR